MPTSKPRLKTKLQTALVVTYLRESGPSTKSQIMRATGIESKRFSNLTQTWRNNPNNDVPYKHSGNKKGATWMAHQPAKPSAVVEVTKTVEKIVEVPVGNLDAMECAISVGNIMSFMESNGITTMTFGNGMTATMANNSIIFDKN